MNDFPMVMDENVYYCGFNSPKSYGGNSYYIQDPEGNWLIDSPKYTNHLVSYFEEHGGLNYIFLTHEDDVADADKYAEHFGARRLIHEAAFKACRDAEIVISGFSDKPFGDNRSFTIIPTPGHTRGHMVLLYKNKFLFSGDHLYFSTQDQHLGAFKDYCWYSWPKQAESMSKLLNFEFEWVLPGHGSRGRLEKSEMRNQLKELVAEMKAA